MGWSIPILRVAGIQLRIHITFLLLIAWIAFAYYTHGGSSAAVGGVLFILLLFACVVLHEFGHALLGKLSESTRLTSLCCPSAVWHDWNASRTNRCRNSLLRWQVQL